MGIFDNITKLFRYGYGGSPNNPANPIIPPLSSVGQTISGTSVNEETALRLSTVWACIRVISESVASLPLEIYKKNKDGTKSIQTKHPLYNLLHSTPNNLMTSFSFRDTIQTQLLLYGNAFVHIERNKAERPISLNILDPKKIQIKIVHGELYYHVQQGGGNQDKVYNQEEVLHLLGMSHNGLVGKSPIECARENLGLSMASLEYGAAFFGNGASLSGVLEHPNSLSKEASERLAYSWNQKFQGPQQAHKTAVLEEGMKYKELGIPPAQAQFLETRRFQTEEIARNFRCPPHMIGDLSRASFSNIEQQSIDFVVHTLRPWLVRWEQELNRKLFKESEKGKFFFKYTIEGLLRGDTKTRSDFYKDLFNIGVLSPNDIRQLENLNPVDGGDTYYVPLNLAPTTVSRDPQLTEDIMSAEDNSVRAISDIDTTPTKGMIEEAKKGIEWRKEFKRGGTKIGLGTAQAIINKSITIDRIKRMYAFHSRHQVDKKAEGYNYGEEGFPSNGRIAIALWGGDEGFKWSKRKTEEIKKEEKSKPKKRNKKTTTKK